MTFIGIDPGKAGGYAAVTYKDGGRVAWARPWDDDEFIADMECYVRAGANVFCVLERVGAMPKQGVKSMFTFGTEYGFIQGVLRAMGIPFETVPPAIWKKAYALGKDKKASIEACKRLFPDVSLLRTERCKTAHDGMAEALLLADYGSKMRRI